MCEGEKICVENPRPGRTGLASLFFQMGSLADILHDHDWDSAKIVRLLEIARLKPQEEAAAYLKEFVTWEGALTPLCTATWSWILTLARNLGKLAEVRKRKRECSKDRRECMHAGRQTGRICA